MWDSLMKNWTTSLPGLLAVICASTDLLGMIPEPYHKYALSVCGFLLGIGLIAAKSANVSHDANGNPQIMSATPNTNAVPAVLLAIMTMGLTACVSDMDLGNGRVMNLAKVETRSAFGVNDSRSRLRDCELAKDGQYLDCHWMESEWRQSTSPGQGGQVAGAALQGMGLGIAGTMIGGTSNAASATSSASSAVTIPAQGHHH